MAGVLAVLAAVAAARGANAQTQSADRPSEDAFDTSDEPNWLSVHRGAGADLCPGPEALKTMVRERLTSVSDPTASGLSVEVELERSAASEFRARIVFTDAGNLVGTRELASSESSCDELGRAVAISIALAIDLRLLVAVGPEEGSADESLIREFPEERPVAPSRVRAISSAPEWEDYIPEHVPEAAERSRTRAALRGGAQLAMGLLPKPAVGPALGVTLQPGRVLSFALSASLFPFEVSTPLRDDAGSVGFTAALVESSACVPLEQGARFGVLLCTGLSLGGLRYSPPPALQAAEARVVTIANATTSVLLRHRLSGGWATVLRGGPALPLIQQRFVYGDGRGGATQLFEMTGAIAVFELAVEYGGDFSRATHKSGPRGPYTP